MVVDVFPLLDFADHGEPARAACQHPRKREAMSSPLRTRPQAAVERGLSSQLKITRNNRVVSSRILLGPPFELARIDAVPKDLVHGRFLNGASARQVFALCNRREF